MSNDTSITISRGVRAVSDADGARVIALATCKQAGVNPAKWDGLLDEERITYLAHIDQLRSIVSRLSDLLDEERRIHAGHVAAYFRATGQVAEERAGRAMSLFRLPYVKWTPENEAALIDAVAKRGVKATSEVIADTDAALAALRDAKRDDLIVTETNAKAIRDWISKYLKADHEIPSDVAALVDAGLNLDVRSKATTEAESALSLAIEGHTIALEG